VHGIPGLEIELAGKPTMAYSKPLPNHRSFNPVPV